VSTAHSSNVDTEMSAAHACKNRVKYAHSCDAETARYLLFIYELIKWVVRNISYIASNVRSMSGI
jgi:hypothetical protein